MISRTLWIVLSISALLVAGCTTAQRPQAAPFPAAEMQNMQSIQHWDVLAGQLSSDLAAKYKYLPPDIKRAIYVDETDSSVFSKSLKSLLITRLVGKGIPIVDHFDQSVDSCRNSNLPCQPLRLKMGVQVVKHDEIRVAYPYKDISLPKIASYAIYFVGDYWTSPAWAILPLSEYIKNDLPPETNTEILVNASLLDGDNIVSSDSSIYYVNDHDIDIYQGGQINGHTETYAPYNMKNAATGIAAREGGCYYAGSARLIKQVDRTQMYEVHCINSNNVTVRCEEYDQCHVVF